MASVILGAENEDEAMQEVYLQCLYRNYLEEEEINEIIKLVEDGAKYAFSTWFTEVKDIDLASIRGWFKKF